MSEFKGNVGTVYTQETDDADKRWQAWFEDFHIIGLGDTEIEALWDAARHTDNLRILITDAIGSLSTTAVGAGGD